MENHPITKTPQEWENHYMQELNSVIKKWQDYNMQIRNNNGGFYGSQGSLAVLNYTRSIREYFNQYNTTADWFTERQMQKFPNYLAFVKKDFDNVINMLIQTYQDSLTTDQKIYAINANAKIDMLTQLNEIYLRQKKAFDDMN